MTSRVCTKNKETKAKRKNSVKKIDQTGKKNGRSREIDGDPATRLAKQINKILQSRTQNIKTVYTSRL